MEEVPERAAFELLAHTVLSTPAFTVGAGVMVILTLSETAVQFPLPVEVSVSVTEPAVISAAEAV